MIPRKCPRKTLFQHTVPHNHLGPIWYYSEPSEVPAPIPQTSILTGTFLPLLTTRQLYYKGAAKYRWLNEIDPITCDYFLLRNIKTFCNNNRHIFFVLWQSNIGQLVITGLALGEPMGKKEQYYVSIFRNVFHYSLVYFKAQKCVYKIPLGWKISQPTF